MLTFKVIVGTLFIGLLLVLAKSIVHAIRAARVPGGYQQEIGLHRRWTNISFWLMVIAILATETMVRFNGGAQNRGLLLIHLGFAVPFALLLIVLRFWITGEHRFRVHKLLAYACMGLYAGAFATGLVLLWRV